MSKQRMATYRLQVNEAFTLRDAAAILPYLARLGVSDMYLSPVFESAKGSTHGYDICDFTRISEERGGPEAFTALDKAAQEGSLKLLLDIVPNHMGIAGENPFWFDVLSKGAASEYWSLFDLRVEKGQKIHLPILEHAVADLIAADDIKLFTHDKYGAGLSVKGRFLPLRPETRERLKNNQLGVNEILEDQHYELVVWTEAFDKISYRRFFDIMDLIGVRVEDEAIYERAHRALLDLIGAHPSIDGVRVDHIDGLADPTVYLQRLAADVGHVLVEKIVMGDEGLPASWPVQGTTGYEFINYLNGVFVDPQNYKILEDYWRQAIEPRWESFHDCVADSKNETLDNLFSSELKRLVKLSSAFGDAEPAEVFWRGMTVGLPVYRTYAGTYPLSVQDKKWIEQARLKARERFGVAFEQAERVFLPVLLEANTPVARQIVSEWQQLSGPAMAKGLEDTAHYRFNPLAALNEVGCEPVVRQDGREDYLAWAARLAREYPGCLLATSTHDTKRSEDTRHRLYILADLPQEWIAFYEAAVKLNAPLREGFAIRPATEYFLYQAVIGIWPFDHGINTDFIDRICAYMRKSVKEARTETSWLKPDKAYEAALEDFIRRVLASGDFLAHAKKFAVRVMAAGAVTSLSVLTLKILGGGVPDIYQGAEGWDFSLVDPDNRRPVDFAAHAAALEHLAQAEEKSGGPDFLRGLCENWQAPELKIWLTKELLRIRKTYLSGDIEIRPLSVSGKDQACVMAYHIAGTGGSGPLIVACPRYAGRFAEDKIPGSSLDVRISGYEGVKGLNLLTGQEGAVGDIGAMFGQFPVVVMAVKI